MLLISLLDDYGHKDPLCRPLRQNGFVSEVEVALGNKTHVLYFRLPDNQSPNFLESEKNGIRRFRERRAQGNKS